jgi:hypothetical protein
MTVLWYPVSLERVKLTRCRGYIRACEGGIHDAEDKIPLCTGVQSPDDRAGPSGTQPGEPGAGVRTKRPGHPQLGYPGGP